MTLWGKIIDLNNFKTGILDDAIQYSRLDFEETRDGKGEMSKPKEFSYEKWTQWGNRYGADQGERSCWWQEISM